MNEKTLFDEIVESFKVIDRDEDGFLEGVELMGVLERQGVMDTERIV